MTFPRRRLAAAWNRVWRGAAPAAVAVALVLTLAPGPAAADKHRPETGRTLTGNYLAGRHAQAQRDLSSAADFLGAALKKAPNQSDLLNRTFILMTVEGRIDEAVALARRLVKVEPKVQAAFLALAVHDIKRGRFAAADKRLREIDDDGLGSVVSPVVRAWTLVAQKKSEEALKLLTAGTKAEGKDTAKETGNGSGKGSKKGKDADKGTGNGTGPLHSMHAALISEMLGRLDEAEKHFLAVTEAQNGLSLRVAQLLGGLYERTGKTDKARALYQRYLKEQPNSQLLDAALARLESGARPKLRVFSVNDGVAEVLFGVASSLRQQNARDTALVLGRLALYLKPRFPVMQILLGDILEADDRLESALEVYEAIDRDSTFSWSARLRVASVLNSLDRIEDSIKHLRKMARDRRDEAGPLISLGDILRSHDRFKEAVEAYDGAIKRIGKLESQHWTLLYARGIALERSQQWTRAEADFLNALGFEPEQPYVLNYLGYSWIDQGLNLDRAQEMIKKAASLRPNDGYIVDSLGWGHYKLGRYEVAVRELEKAVELRPQDAVINDHLGDAYWRVGRHREAVFQWNRSLTLDPDKDLIARIREKLKKGLVEDTETAKKPRDGG